MEDSKNQKRKKEKWPVEHTKSILYGLFLT